MIDAGIGLEKSQQEKIFAEFTQADASIVRKYGGTGLGLSLTKKLVELLSGHIMLESQLGIGSRFSFVIPVSVKDTDWILEENKIPANLAAKREEKPADVANRYQGGVLLADDNCDNQRLVELYIHRMGLSISIVDNGELALRKLTEKNSMLYSWTCKCR